MKQTVTTLDCFPIPDSTEIEKQVIADLVSDPSQIMTAKGIINGQMFYNENCRDAWKTLCEMDNRKESIDIISVNARLGNKFIAEYLSDKLFKETGSGLRTKTDCEILQSISMRRTAYLFFIDGLKKTSNNATNPEDLLSLPEKLSEQMLGNMVDSSSGKEVSVIFNELAEHIEQIQLGNVRRVCSGIPSLDEVLYGGFDEGELIILAAGTSVGKTAFSLHMVRAAASSGFPVQIISLEMTEMQICQRLLSATEYVNTYQMATGKINWNNYETASGCYNNVAPINVKFCPGGTIDEIETTIKLAHRQGKCKMAVVDYLQIIRYDYDRNTRYDQILGYICSRLKAVAGQCHIPVILLSQINREGEKDGKAPGVQNLRGSGEIGNNGDVILILEREQNVEQRSELRTEDLRINLRIVKHRQGPAGNKIALKPNSSYTSFSEIGAV